MFKSSIYRNRFIFTPLIYCLVLCFIFHPPISYAVPPEENTQSSNTQKNTDTEFSPKANVEELPNDSPDERIDDPEVVKERLRVQEELFKTSEASLTNELQPIVEDLRTFLPIAIEHLSEKVSTYGREEVLEWAKGYTEHKRLTFGEVGESKINWVSTEDKKAEVPVLHNEALILRLTLYSAPHLALLVYDPRDINPETNPHLRKYIARIHTERKQSVILLGVRDGQLVEASGESVPSLRISFNSLQSAENFRNNLKDMGRWWGQRWKAVWVPPNINDSSLAVATSIANTASTGVAIGAQYLTSQMTQNFQDNPQSIAIGDLMNEPILLNIMSVGGPHIDPKVMGLSFGYTLLLGIFINTYLEWVTKGHSIAQYFKNYTSTLPFNLLALTFVDGVSINPLTPEGRIGWATAIGVGVLANMVKVPMNKAWRILSNKRVLTGNYSIPIPFSDRTIDISKSRTHYQIFYRQIFEIPKLLALLGLSVFSIEYINATIDAGDVLLLASLVSWYRYALYQAEKHNHRSQVQLRRTWNAMVFPIRESLGILKDTLTKGPRAGVERSRLAVEYMNSEIAAPIANKVKNVCQVAFGKKPKSSQQERLSKEDIDNILSQITPL